MVKKYVEDTVNFSQGSKICGYHDEVKQSVIWYYQSTSGSSAVDAGIAYDYSTGNWWFLGQGRSACAERNVFDYAISAEEGGNDYVFFENFGVNSDASAMVARIQTKPFDGGVADLIKEIEQVRIGYTGSGLQYRLGWQDSEADEIVWGPYQMVSSGFSVDDYRISGRYVTLELYSNAAGDEWDVSSIDVHGFASGER